MQFFKLGIRNIYRNRRRSLATGLAIASGFAAINLFSGYIDNVYSGLSQQAIRGERLGHLMITKQDALSSGKLEPEKYLFSGAELSRLLELLRTDTDLELVTLRLGVSGIVSNGQVSTIFIGEGMIPADVVTLRGNFRQDRGELLNPASPGAAAVASDLADMLQLKPGGYGVLMASTVHGQTNAIDMDVGAVYNTGSVGTNDKFLLLPLELVQQLLDTDGADRVILLLRDPEQIEAVRDRLYETLKSAGIDFEFHTWQERSTFYKRVRGLFDMIFAFIFSIVLVIVLMSVVNTMSMSVVERTREIGTLRALGMNRRNIITLFTIEGFLLMLIGVVVGLALTAVVSLAVNSAGFSYVPPNTSDSVDLIIAFVPSVLIQSFMVLTLVAVIAALLPARRAARMLIVDALGHV